MVAHAETAFRGVPRGRALKQTLATLEQMWGGGAFGAATNVAGGELPWIVLRDGGGGGEDEDEDSEVAGDEDEDSEVAVDSEG